MRPELCLGYVVRFCSRHLRVDLDFEEQGLHQAAGYQWHGGLVNLKKLDLTCDDVVQLAPGQFSTPLDEAACYFRFTKTQNNLARSYWDIQKTAADLHLKKWSDFWTTLTGSGT